MTTNNKLVHVRIGGVDEFFNSPIQVAIARGDFEKIGVDLEFVETPEGTGQIVQGLSDGSLHMATVLVEGILKAIGSSEKPFSCVTSVWVNTALEWGVFVGKNNLAEKIDDVKNSTFAISRKGSGSELMAYVMAEQNNFKWNPNDAEKRFFPVGGIQNLIETVNDKEKQGDVFLWSSEMTAPYVEKGELKQIGTVTAPWPAFVTAVNNDFLSKNVELVSKIMKVMHESALRVQNELQNDSSDESNNSSRISSSSSSSSSSTDSTTTELVAKRYNLTPAAARQALERVDWRGNEPMKTDVCNQVIQHLVQLGLLTKSDFANEACITLPNSAR